jgi:hypothetical protein
MHTRFFQMFLSILPVVVASSCSTTAEPEAVREMRPRLAQLRRGMSDDQMRETLQLSPFTLGGGCLHQWTYVCEFAPSNTLAISMTPHGTNGWFFERATLRGPGRREESWPR